MALAMVTLAGCSSPDRFSRIINEPLPVGPGVRQQFGKVALVPADAALDIRFPGLNPLANNFPPWGTGTYHKLEAATRVGGDPDKRVEKYDDPRWLAMDPRNYYDAGRLVCISVAAGTAALIEGVVSTVSQAELDASKESIKHALAEEALQKGTEEDVLRLAAAAGHIRLTSISQTNRVFPISQLSSNNNFSALAEAGFDSVLIIRVHDIQFGVVRRLDPPIELAIRADVFVFRASDGSLLASQMLDYRSVDRKFTAWGAKDAKYLRAEIRLAELRIAQAILTEFFDVNPQPS